MAVKPFGRAGRRHSPRQRPAGSDRTKSTAPTTASIPSRSARRLFSRSLIVEFARKLGPDPPLDGGDEILAGEPHVILQRVLDAVPMPEVGEQLRELAIPLELALEEHAVEVEDDRAEVRHRLRTTQYRPEPPSRRASPPVA